jgi:hypothetical protein
VRVDVSNPTFLYRAAGWTDTSTPRSAGVSVVIGAKLSPVLDTGRLIVSQTPNSALRFAGVTNAWNRHSWAASAPSTSSRELSGNLLRISSPLLDSNAGDFRVGIAISSASPPVAGNTIHKPNRRPTGEVVDTRVAHGEAPRMELLASEGIGLVATCSCRSGHGSQQPSPVPVMGCRILLSWENCARMATGSGTPYIPIRDFASPHRAGSTVDPANAVTACATGGGAVGTTEPTKSLSSLTFNDCSM